MAKRVSSLVIAALVLFLCVAVHVRADNWVDLDIDRKQWNAHEQLWVVRWIGNPWRIRAWQERKLESLRWTLRRLGEEAAFCSFEAFDYGCTEINDAVYYNSVVYFGIPPGDYEVVLVGRAGGRVWKDHMYVRVVK